MKKTFAWHGKRSEIQPKKSKEETNKHHRAEYSANVRCRWNSWILAVLSRAAHPNFFTLDTALPRALRNTSTRCEAEQMNGCGEKKIEGQTKKILSASLDFKIKKKKTHRLLRCYSPTHSYLWLLLQALFSTRGPSTMLWKLQIHLCNMGRVYIYGIQWAG